MVTQMFTKHDYAGVQIRTPVFEEPRWPAYTKRQIRAWKHAYRKLKKMGINVTEIGNIPSDFHIKENFQNAVWGIIIGGLVVSNWDDLSNFKPLRRRHGRAH